MRFIKRWSFQFILNDGEKIRAFFFFNSINIGVSARCQSLVAFWARRVQSLYRIASITMLTLKILRFCTKRFRYGLESLFKNDLYQYNPGGFSSNLGRKVQRIWRFRWWIYSLMTRGPQTADWRVPLLPPCLKIEEKKQSSKIG